MWINRRKYGLYKLNDFLIDFYIHVPFITYLSVHFNLGSTSLSSEYFQILWRQILLEIVSRCFPISQREAMYYCCSYLPNLEKFIWVETSINLHIFSGSESSKGKIMILGRDIEHCPQHICTLGYRTHPQHICTLKIEIPILNLR